MLLLIMFITQFGFVNIGFLFCKCITSLCSVSAQMVVILVLVVGNSCGGILHVATPDHQAQSSLTVASI
jgi:hypothetical protein